MAAADLIKRFFLFCPVPITCQFTTSSIQHVPERLRTTRALVQTLAGGAAELLKNKTKQSSQARGRKTNFPGFQCPFVDAWMSAGNLSSVAPVLVTRRYFLTIRRLFLVPKKCCFNAWKAPTCYLAHLTPFTKYLYAECYASIMDVGLRSTHRGRRMHCGISNGTNLSRGINTSRGTNLYPMRSMYPMGSMNGIHVIS